MPTGRYGCTHHTYQSYATQLDIEALLSSSAGHYHHHHHGHNPSYAFDEMDTSVAIATDLNLNASAHGAAGAATGATAPLPDSIKWLLTIFLGLYVGGECGTYVTCCRRRMLRSIESSHFPPPNDQ